MKVVFFPTPGSFRDLARRVARAPRGTLGWRLQQVFRQAEHHLSRGSRRRPLFRLDRRPPQESERRGLYRSLHGPQPKEPVEHGEHQESREAFRRRQDAPRRPRGVRRCTPPTPQVFLRTTKPGELPRRTGAPFPVEPQGLALLPGPASVVPEDGNLSGSSSAKQEETRQRRLAVLIADSEPGQPIKPLRRSPVPKR